MNVPQEEYERIEAMIRSDNSPVGIDAAKTHIYIIHTLHEIQKRLANLEMRAAQKTQSPGPAPGKALQPRRERE